MKNDNRYNNPNWRETPPIKESYRSIFKWGNTAIYKHPNNGLYRLLKEKLKLTDDNFIERKNDGDGSITHTKKSNLTKKQISVLQKIVGIENISLESYDRVKYSTGQSALEILNLRNKVTNNICDAVVHPRSKSEILEIIKFCNKQKIPIYTYGGGTSVNFGIQPVRYGITIVISTYINRVLSLNEINQTITVEAGIMGPALEIALNNAPDKLNAKMRYTCGHFPQSFEYSTVGGWTMAMGSGQLSSYYGDASHLISSMEFITSKGIIKTHSYPAAATGPDMNSILTGSEGAFGILTEVTLKIFRHMPQNNNNFAYIFPDWISAVSTAREITQSEFGMPGLLRISDPEETDIATKMYGIDGKFVEQLFNLFSLKPNRRCLMIGQSLGEKKFSKNIKKQVKKICKSYGGRYVTGYPVKKWEHGRFTDPYMRDDIMDYGIIIDTLETSVTWDNLFNVYDGVREYITKNEAICMTHCSHFYPQGTNLYFIIIIKFQSIQLYWDFFRNIIDRIIHSGGSLSHHHGIGKMLAPWMENYMGNIQMDILRAIKTCLDPENIMNPGGQLGLDFLKNIKV